MKRVFLSLIIMFLSLSLFAQKHYSVKITKTDKYVIVPANIEGYEIEDLIFDTGCVTTLLLDEDLERLKNWALFQKDRKPDTYMKGYDGRKMQVKKYVVPSLTIGRMRLRNVVVLFSPVAKTRTLGQNVMRRFERLLLTIKIVLWNLNIKNSILNHRILVIWCIIECSSLMKSQVIISGMMD